MNAAQRQVIALKKAVFVEFAIMNEAQLDLVAGGSVSGVVVPNWGVIAPDGGAAL